MPSRFAIAPTLSLEDDPIHAAIAAHRSAAQAWLTMKIEIKRLLELADRTVGPPEIEIQSEGRTVRAACFSDILRVIPVEQPERLIEYATRLRDRLEARLAVTGDIDQLSEAESEAEYTALKRFESTVPTTMDGLLAKIHYAAELQKQDGTFDLFDSNVLLASLGDAVSRLQRRPVLHS